MGEELIGKSDILDNPVFSTIMAELAKVSDDTLLSGYQERIKLGVEKTIELLQTEEGFTVSSNGNLLKSSASEFVNGIDLATKEFVQVITTANGDIALAFLRPEAQDLELNQDLLFNPYDTQLKIPAVFAFTPEFINNCMAVRTSTKRETLKLSFSIQVYHGSFGIQQFQDHRIPFTHSLLSITFSRLFANLAELTFDWNANNKMPGRELDVALQKACRKIVTAIFIDLKANERISQ